MLHIHCSVLVSDFIAMFSSGVSFHSVTALCLFSFCFSAPSRDAKPSVQLPDRSGRTANTQPRSHWQPAKQYGQPDARHDGPVPSNAVLSGILMMGRQIDEYYQTTNEKELILLIEICCF